MFFVPSCFHCDRPQPDKRGRYLLIPVCYYVALKNNLPMDTIKNKILNYGAPFEYCNDSVLDLYYTGKEDVDQYIKMIDVEFTIDSTNFFVSW